MSQEELDTQDSMSLPRRFRAVAPTNLSNATPLDLISTYGEAADMFGAGACAFPHQSTEEVQHGKK